MGRKKYVLILGLVALVCSAWIGGAATGNSDRAIWEYRTMFGNAMQLSEFNGMGNDGWELVAVTCQEGNSCAFYFKHRK